VDARALRIKPVRIKPVRIKPSNVGTRELRAALF